MADTIKAPAGNASVVQTASVPAGNIPAVQNAQASTRNVPAVQASTAPAQNIAGQAAHPPAPRSDRLHPDRMHPDRPPQDRVPEPRDPSARDPSTAAVHNSAGLPAPAAHGATEPQAESPRRTSRLAVMRRAGVGLARLVSSAAIRFLMFFGTGIAVTLAWQSYRDAGREAITNWCGWWAPPPATPAAQNSAPSDDLVSVSPDLLKTTSQNLAAVRESIERLTDELSRLQIAEKLAAELRLRAAEQHAAPPPGNKTAAGLPPASRPPTRQSPPAN